MPDQRGRDVKRVGGPYFIKNAKPPSPDEGGTLDRGLGGTLEDGRQVVFGEIWAMGPASDGRRVSLDSDEIAGRITHLLNMGEMNQMFAENAPILPTRDDIKESLYEWGQGQSYPLGSFLMAVVSNDLFEALGRADGYNLRSIHSIVSYIYNELPPSCWGSPERVKEWMELHRQVGYQPSEGIHDCTEHTVSSDEGTHFCQQCEAESREEAANGE